MTQPSDRARVEQCHVGKTFAELAEWEAANNQSALATFERETFAAGVEAAARVVEAMAARRFTKDMREMLGLAVKAIRNLTAAPPASEGLDADALVEEMHHGKDELRRLMDSIWRAEYLRDAPNWQPLDDLPGMVSQIDNMYAGVRSQRDATLSTIRPTLDAERAKWDGEVADWLDERIADFRTMPDDWQSAADTASDIKDAIRSGVYRSDERG